MQNAATGKFAKRHIIETFYKISGATEYLPAVIPILPQEVCAPVVKFLGISNRQGIPFELSGHRIETDRHFWRLHADWGHFGQGTCAGSGQTEGFGKYRNKDSIASSNLYELGQRYHERGVSSFCHYSPADSSAVSFPLYCRKDSG